MPARPNIPRPRRVDGAGGADEAYIAASLIALLSVPAEAAPIGRWFSDWGQGNQEYTIQNDSAGSDTFAFFDTTGGFAHGGVGIRVEVGGHDPAPGSTVVITIGGDEFEFTADKNGEGRTDCHVCAATFDALWTAARKGTVMRVRLADGHSTIFTLKGAAKVLPAQPPKADFYR